jgi:hypothetical protein
MKRYEINVYRVSQNSRIPNSERARKGPSGARKILRKKNSLFLKKITGLQINLYLEQPMEIQLFATCFQRRK